MPARSVETRGAAKLAPSAVLAALLAALPPAPAHAQEIVCCSQLIGVGGDWFGAIRVDDCQGYFNSAPPAIQGRMCQQRQSLSCIDTSRCDDNCRDPAASSGAYTRDPFGPETPADIAPQCQSCPGGTWQLKLAEVTYHPTERLEPFEGSQIRLALCATFPDACAPTIIPQCAYTYESIWLCVPTREVAKKTKTLVTDGYCQPKG